MGIAKRVLAAVNDLCQLNASEALAGSVVFQLVGAAPTQTITFEAKLRDAPTWIAVQAVNLTTGTGTTTATADGLYRIDTSAQLDVRARVTAGTTGSFDVYAGVSLG